MSRLWEVLLFLLAASIVAQLVQLHVVPLLPYIYATAIVGAVVWFLIARSRRW